MRTGASRETREISPKTNSSATISPRTVTVVRGNDSTILRRRSVGWFLFIAEGQSQDFVSPLFRLDRKSKSPPFRLAPSGRSLRAGSCLAKAARQGRGTRFFYSNLYQLPATDSLTAWRGGRQ